MADQVSRVASGGLSASFRELLMNFLAWCPGRPEVPQDERNKVDVRVSIKLDLLCSLRHMTWAGAGCCDEGWVAGERRKNGNIKIRGGDIVIENEVHARLFHLSVHHTDTDTQTHRHTHTRHTQTQLDKNKNHEKQNQENT